MLSKNEVKYIQSLGHKKRRDEERVFLVEGSKILAELIEQHAQQIVRLYATETFYINHPTAKQLKEHFIVTEEELMRISQMQTANQALAIVQYFPEKDWDPSVEGWTLALDGIRDPGNLGTIIRLADWFGIQQLVCSPDCADLYNPKVVQASMGSIMRVNLIEKDLSLFLTTQSKPVAGAVLGGEPLPAYAFPATGILVIGNESIGIRADVMPLLTKKLTIPGFGHAESLNAAIATSIFLWEMKRGGE
jgi:RNA methyltransferase, TrmH family